MKIVTRIVRHWIKTEINRQIKKDFPANIDGTHLIFIEYLSDHKLHIVALTGCAMLCYSHAKMHTIVEESDSFLWLYDTHNFYNFSSNLLHRIIAGISFFFLFASPTLLYFIFFICQKKLHAVFYFVYEVLRSSLLQKKKMTFACTKSDVLLTCSSFIRFPRLYFYLI